MVLTVTGELEGEVARVLDGLGVGKKRILEALRAWWVERAPRGRERFHCPLGLYLKEQLGEEDVLVGGSGVVVRGKRVPIKETMSKVLRDLDAGRVSWFR